MKPEDQRLIELLGTSPGVAIEVGAADGEFTSPTLALERIGWHVICVEPNPLYAAKARAHRRHVIEAACSDFNDPSYPFTICNVEHDCKLHEMQGGSALDVQREDLERLGWTPKGERQIRVDVRTLDDILFREMVPAVDFVSIDTEGTEDSVLAGFDVRRWMPRLIVVENWPGVNKTDHILLPLGYHKIDRVMGNYTDWYSR